MRRPPVLLIDGNYMCHRAWHAIGALGYGEQGTGAIFGVLRDITILQDEFRTTRTVFAFDGPAGRRYKLLDSYKSGRRKRHEEETEEEKAARADFRVQIARLCDTHLPAAGFRNVWTAPGFEADDIIAAKALSAPLRQEVVIIGSDQDLWQCLRPNVWQYNPNTKKGYTYDAFVAEWGLQPHQWAQVKALAGCKSDDIPGVPGVGEKTAAKYLRGELGAHTKAHAKIEDFPVQDLDRNLKLTTLPFPGTPCPKLQKDEVTPEKWGAMTDGLGMDSLKNQAPRVAGSQKKGRKRGFGF